MSQKIYQDTLPAGQSVTLDLLGDLGAEATSGTVINNGDDEFDVDWELDGDSSGPFWLPPAGAKAAFPCDLTSIVITALDGPARYRVVAST